MTTEGGEREFRIRPPRPRRIRTDEARVWSRAFGQIMHIARMTSRRSGAGSASGVRRFSQRCAVRVTYVPNRIRGQWAAHGRYLAREGAAGSQQRDPASFGSAGTGPDIVANLGDWQRAGDPRLFKLIISPEFGDRLDLEALTHRLMAKMESDLGGTLEWTAIVHRNTEYPHVHVALRGITRERSPLRLDRDYIRHGMRRIAEDIATAQLGYRTEIDALEAQRREVHQSRFTSLDRILNRSNTGANTTEYGDSFRVDLTNTRRQSERDHLNGRLIVLHTMGLAEPEGPDRWRVRSEFEAVLRAVQRSSDRQRVLAAHGALLSDPRLPVTLTEPGTIRHLEGRVLGHGEDEASGRSYLMFEGTDHKVHFIYHTPRMRTDRGKGKLGVNSFVRFRGRSIKGRSVLLSEELGDSEKVLRDVGHMRRTAGVLLKQGQIPSESRLAGWLGRYEAAIVKSARDIERERVPADRGRSDQSRGR